MALTYPTTGLLLNYRGGGDHSKCGINNLKKSTIIIKFTSILDMYDFISNDTKDYSRIIEYCIVNQSLNYVIGLSCKLIIAI